MIDPIQITVLTNFYFAILQSSLLIGAVEEEKDILVEAGQELFVSSPLCEFLFRFLEQWVILDVITLLVDIF